MLRSIYTEEIGMTREWQSRHTVTIFCNEEYYLQL